MKTINFELSKILTKLWLLDNIETEYFYSANWLYQNWRWWNRDGVEYWWIKYKLYDNEKIKTLTLEEAIEFLKQYTKEQNFKIETNDYMNLWSIYWQITPIFREKTLLEAIEKLLEFLLDNNLLTNK